METTYVIVYLTEASPLYYEGWGLPKAKRSFGQFTSNIEMAHRYGSLHQARIARTKLLQERVAMKDQDLIIREEVFR